MRAAAFAFVVLTATACSDTNDQVDDDPLLRAPAPGMISPGRGGQPSDEIIDIDLFPFLGGGGTVATPDRGGTPCDLDDGELQTWANENLACGTCYAMACGGEVAAHVCTGGCGDDLPMN
jgi:hypothetical protein